MTEISFDPSEPRPAQNQDHPAAPAAQPLTPAGLHIEREEAPAHSGPSMGPSEEEPPRGGRGHTRDCLALDTDDPLRQCARPGCDRAKHEREPGKGGRPSKYCCKLCANEASRAADSAPAAVATHTAVSAFTAEAGQIRARLHQRDAQLAAEREDLHQLDERLTQVWEAITTQLAQAERGTQQAESDAEQARTSMRAAHTARQTAEQERDAALRHQQEALHAQRQAEEHRDRIHNEARANAERLGVQIGQLTAQLHDEQGLTKRQAEQLGALGAELSRATGLAEERAAALAERETQLHEIRAEVRSLQEHLEQAAAHLTTTRQQLHEATTAAEEARAETRAVRGDLAGQQRRFDEQRDQLQTQRDEARLSQATAEARLEMAERELQTLRRQLAAAQAATGLVVPPLADVDGRPGVRLPGGAFDAVTLQDGVVTLHRDDSAIPLGDTSQSPAQARALSAALQAVTAPPPA
ncbi:hypothetical protein GBF35_24245 [Nonomuraea phyllanthi]|uniref:hypothetical protein n=1 Tax=Nonomuraea phyllanthi TaxID=2219224 RepID=UPI001293F8D2|nr:hypothetical protein [Nonomuraea phyllanthi]QFY09345.1 hypothetical protein GBF35_24245 [Nonomuraea phyllanthi]